MLSRGQDWSVDDFVDLLACGRENDASKHARNDLPRQRSTTHLPPKLGAPPFVRSMPLSVLRRFVL